MVLTTLFVRLHKPSPRTRHGSPIFRSIGLGLLLLSLSLLTACGAGDGSGNDSLTAAPGNGKGHGYGLQPDLSGGSSATTTVSVSLAWNAVPDQSITGYFIYYGTQSPNSSGSCSYSTSLYTTSTLATVDGLAPNTTYFFAVSAYNGLESPCSAEVSTVT